MHNGRGRHRASKRPRQTNININNNNDDDDNNNNNNNTEPVVRRTDKLIGGANAGVGGQPFAWIRGRGSQSFHQRLGGVVGTTLARRLMTSMVSMLVESVSHSTIPALLHTVSHSPLQVCALCVYVCVCWYAEGLCACSNLFELQTNGALLA